MKYKYIVFLLMLQFSFISSVPNFVLMGPPGAGKGTFSDTLVKKYNYMQICPGALLRAEAEKQSALGKSIKELAEQAKPIEPSIVCSIVQYHLEKALSTNVPFVLDGFPKNKACFEFLVMFLKKHNMQATFIHFYANDNVCFNRITSRLECHTCGATFNSISKKPVAKDVCDFCKNKLEQRKGDDAKTANYRLQEFHENIEPVIKEVKNSVDVIEIDTSCVPISNCEMLCEEILMYPIEK